MLYALAAAYPNPIVFSLALFPPLFVSILLLGDYTVVLLPLFLTLSPPFLGLPPITLDPPPIPLNTLILLLLSFLALAIYSSKSAFSRYPSMFCKPAPILIRIGFASILLLKALSM
jgi:hypothetical protein